MSFKGIAKCACCSFVCKWHKTKKKWLKKKKRIFIHITKKSWLDLCVWRVQTLKACHQESVFSVLFPERPSFKQFHSQADSPHACDGSKCPGELQAMAQHRICKWEPSGQNPPEACELRTMFAFSRAAEKHENNYVTRSAGKAENNYYLALYKKGLLMTGQSNTKRAILVCCFQ